MTPIEDQARSIFLAALEQPADHWPGFLDEACGANVELRARVEQLLHAHREMGSIHGGEEGEPLNTARYHARSNDQQPTEGPGAVIGPYKLLEQIGEGGFGVVYMAEQMQPVRRKVALKILKPGMETRQVVARFDAERQALAIMDHPNIARVFDGGATPSGRPYFVMELVRGVPITEFCDQNHLTPRQRLELFITVCQAVQHAHQKGIIHRDLKPSNVLVSVHDTMPVVKVIDFGIAKALGQELTDKTLFTGFAQMIGTPLYMSPEQAGQSGLDVDTRSDIYSLGVMLYELLTGTTPFTKDRFKQAAYDEIRRIIREEEPPRPSTRLSDSKDSLPSISAQRQTEPARLTRLVRGELDWIAMKALEKDRSRRYETANGFAMDVQRYLADEAVQACPPSVGYRLRKFVRRNKGPVLAAAALLVLLVGGITGTTAGLVRARAERDDKEKARQEAELNFRKAREAVDEYFTRVSETTLLDEPALAPLRRQLLEAARRYYDGFVREHGGSADLQGELVAAHFRLAIINYELGPDEDWLTPFRQGVDLLEDLVRKKPDVAALRSLAAGVYRPIGLGLRVESPDETRAAAERACALWEELVRAYPEAPGFQNDLATWYIVLGSCYRDRKQPEEALRCHRRSSELREKLVAANPGVPRYRAALVNSLANVTEALAQLGRRDEAQQAGRRSLEIANRLVADYPNMLVYLDLLAWLQRVLSDAWQRAGRVEEAEQASRQRLAAYEKLARALPWVSRYRQELFDTHVSLGDLLWDGGRRAEAAKAYGRAAALESTLDPDNADAQDSLAWFLAACADPQYRDPRRAVALAKKCVERQPQYSSYWLTLGVAHYRAGDWKAAAEVLTKAAQMSERDFSYNWFFLAMAQWQLGDRERARESYATAAEWMRRHEPWNYELRRFRAEAEELLGRKAD